MSGFKILTLFLFSFLMTGPVFSQSETEAQELAQSQIIQENNADSITIGEPGEAIFMGGEQEDLLSELAPEEESEAELRVNVMASVAAIAQMSCTIGEEAESFKSVQDAALEYLKKENLRVLDFQNKMSQMQEEAKQKKSQRQNGESFDYQIEGIKMQMVSTQMMIQNYISEENGSITNRNKLIEALEQAEFKALEEFENFENEVNICQNWIDLSKQRAEEGCERIAQVEECDGDNPDDCEIVEQSEPEEGSCEAVEKISSLEPKLLDYKEHFAAVMGSTEHKERYEQIKEAFEALVVQVPSGEWKGQVLQCQSKLQELNQKTEAVCELNIISVEDELDDEELEERELAQVNSFEKQPDAFNSMTSSDSEKRYLEYVTMKKQIELDPYLAQSLNRPVLYPVIIEDLVAQNQIELQKVQRHYQEYEKVLNLYNGFKKEGGPQVGPGDASEKENNKGSGQNNLAEQQGPEGSEGALSSSVAFSGRSDFGLSSAGNRGFRNSALSDGANSDSKQEFGSTVSGGKNQRGVFSGASASLGRSNALSASQAKRKDELSKRAESFVKSLGKSSPVVQKRNANIENSRRIFGAALTRKSKTIGDLSNISKKDSNRGNLSLNRSNNNLDQAQSLNSSRGASVISRQIKDEGAQAKSRKAENSGKKTSRVIGYKKSESKEKNENDLEEEGQVKEEASSENKLTRLEKSQREIARIYSDYKKSGRSSSKTSRSGGEIGEREDDLFEIITRRYIVSGFKRLDGIED